jgi:hypothetical protein
VTTPIRYVIWDAADHQARAWDQQRFRQWIEDERLSFGNAGLMLGVDTNTVWAWYHGVRTPKAQVLRTIWLKNRTLPFFGNAVFSFGGPGD